MAESRSEMASAYVTIMPSFKGLAKSLGKAIKSAVPEAEKELDEVGKKAGSKIGDQFGNQFSNRLGKSFSASGAISRSVLSLGKFTGNTLISSVSAVGRTFKDTMIVGANAAGAALGASIAAVGGQMAAGGLARALNINTSEATLQAMGLTAKEMASIFDSANQAVDGTSYALDAAVKSSSKFLSAGVAQGAELTDTLKTAVKMANISGQGFEDSANLLAKFRGSDIIYWQDIQQLQDRNIDVQGALAKALGKTRTEIKKMASSGTIGFKQFQDAIDSIEFDAVLFAQRDVKASFGNLRTSLNRVGADLWTPIIDGAAPMFGDLKKLITDFSKTPVWQSIANAIKTNFAGGMQNATKYIEDFQKTVDKLTGNEGAAVKLSKEFDKFKKTIKGIEGPLIGVGVAMSSGFLSKIPVVGGLIGKLSIGVGLMGGSLYQMYQDSELMQGSLGGLKDALKNALGGFGGAEEGLMKTLGDSFAGVVDSLTGAIEKIDLSGTGGFDLSGLFTGIFENIAGFIETIASNGEQIGGAIKDMFVSIREAIGGAANIGEDQNIGEWLGSFVSDIMVWGANILENVVPVIVNIAGALTDVITSDFTKGVLEFALNLAKWATDNKAVLYGAATIFGTLFVANKLSGPILAMTSFMGKMKVGGKGAAAGSSGIGTIITSLAALGPVIVGALPGLGLLVLGVTTVIAALTVVAGLMELTGVFDIWRAVFASIHEIMADFLQFMSWAAIEFAKTFNVFATNVAAGLNELWVPISTVIFDIYAILKDIFVTIVELIITYAGSIASAISGVIETLGTSIALVIDSVAGLLSTLSEDGVSAGAGALAAAAGIGALAIAMAGFGAGNALGSAGNFIGSGFDWLGDKLFGAGDEDSLGIGQIIKLGEAMQGFEESIKFIPTALEQAGNGAFSSGWLIMENLGQGMLDNLAIVYERVIAEINRMMSEIQRITMETQFNINVNSPAMGGASSYTPSSSVYNKTTNYDVNVNNSSVVKSLARSAR